ncbi:SusC/RagA family TonB-linked outer membrane protein [Pedobacter sp. NJ-S-72]
MTDNKGQGIPGVSVKVKGTTTVAVTDSKGLYAINVPDVSSVLVFTYIGFTAQELIVGNKSEINVVLQESQVALDDVVVVGYGTTKQRNLTTAVVRVKSEDLNTSTASNFQQSLQGKAAGVQVIQATGQPGAGVAVQIRSNPSKANAGVLYVIDGVPVNDAAETPNGVGYYGKGGVDQSPLNFINPNDIESIDFLKDASSASIYGARAGAGVVLITTKKGKEGKTRVDYSVSYGIQNVDKMYKVLNAKDYMNQRNLLAEEVWYRTNKIAPYYGTVDPASVTPFKQLYSASEIAATVNGKSAPDAITRGGYTEQQHNLSISGGTNKTSYLLSANYFNQKGVVIGSDYKRYNGRLNLEQSVSDKIKVGGNVIISNSTTGNVITGGENEGGGILTAAIYWPANLPLRDENGGYPLNPFYKKNIPNPLSYETVTDNTDALRLLANGYAEWSILPELKARMNASFDQSNSKRSAYLPITFLYGSTANGRCEHNTDLCQN